jgi:hypothetical protein
MVQGDSAYYSADCPLIRDRKVMTFKTEQVQGWAKARGVCNPLASHPGTRTTTASGSLPQPTRTYAPDEVVMIQGEVVHHRRSPQGW